MVQFKDLGKKAKDLFSKQYDYKNEIKVTNKSSGVKIENTFTSGPVAAIKANWSHGTVGDIEITGDSAGKSKAQTKLSDLAGTGVNLTLVGESSGKLSAESVYCFDGLSTLSKFTHSGKKNELNISAVYGLEGVSVGGMVNIDCANPAKPTDFNVGTEWSDKNLTASIVTSKFGEDLSISYYQKLSCCMALGSKMEIKSDDSIMHTFGTEYALDSDTSLKAMTNNKGTWSGSVTRTLPNPKAKVCVSAAFDSIGGKYNKCGVSINLGDF